MASLKMRDLEALRAKTALIRAQKKVDSRRIDLVNEKDGETRLFSGGLRLFSERRELCTNELRNLPRHFLQFGPSR